MSATDQNVPAAPAEEAAGEAAMQDWAELLVERARAEGVEPYDDHDDVLHLRALADPERYQRRLANGERAFATAVALD